MTQLLPDIFAIEVAYVATKFEVRSHELRPQIRYEWFNKIRYIPLPVGSYQILFTTKDCSEEQAGSVVEQQRGGGNYKDYLVAGSLAKTGTYLMSSARSSLRTLLVSHDLNLSKNYLLIKKQPQ